MKTKLMSSVIVLSIASLAASAEEFSWGDAVFQPRVYVGYADYELKSGNFTKIFENGEILERPVVIDSRNTKLQFSGPIFGIGATVASGAFFGDLYYQSTPNEEADAGYDDDLGNNIGAVNAQHDDWAISLGYMITEQWSVFAGYKSGNTEWDQIVTKINITERWDGRFEQDGPFIGVSYSLPIEPGVLTFRAAYAYLNGTFERNTYIVGRDLNDNVKLDGNSNAYSLGLSWTQSLTENLGFSIGANYQNYDFDLSGGRQNSQSERINFNNGSMTETLFTLNASLIYRF